MDTNEQNKINENIRNLQIQKKITEAKNWVSSLEARICQKFNLPKDQFKIAPTFSANGGIICESRENSISLNIDANKFLNCSSMELYALLSTSVYKSSAYNKLKEAYKDNSQVSEQENVQSDQNSSDSVSQAKDILKKYIKSFLNKYFYGQINSKAPSSQEINEMSEDIASDIIESGSSYNLNEKSVEALLKPYLDTDLLKEENEELNVDKISDDKVYTSRVSKLNSLAEQYFADPSTTPEAISYVQQAKELEVLSSNCKFSDLNNSANLQQFCESYVKTFMQSNGLKANSIKVVFDNSMNSFGQYVEESDGYQEIRINVTKASSKSELLMTLSHELTHAVESSINKGQGIMTVDGSGLNRNIDQEVGVNKGDKDYAFLKELNDYCYHLNPHERSARIQELSGLKFAQNVYKNDADPTFGAQIEKSINKYKNYQQKTINMAAQLDDFIKEAKVKVYDLHGEKRKIAEAKIQYLEEMQSELDMKGEERSLMDAQQIYDELYGTKNKTTGTKGKGRPKKLEDPLNENEEGPEGLGM